MFTKSTLAILISAALLAVSTGANAAKGSGSGNGKEVRAPSPLCAVGSVTYIGDVRAALECRGDGSFGGVDAGDAPDAPDVENEVSGTAADND